MNPRLSRRAFMGRTLAVGAAATLPALRVPAASPAAPVDDWIKVIPILDDRPARIGLLARDFRLMLSRGYEQIDRHGFIKFRAVSLALDGTLRLCAGRPALPTLASLIRRGARGLLTIPPLWRMDALTLDGVMAPRAVWDAFAAEFGTVVDARRRRLRVVAGPHVVELPWATIPACGYTAERASMIACGRIDVVGVDSAWGDGTPILA